MNVYERRGVRTLINAKGPATRLSGGIMRPEVIAAMAEAAGHCVDMAELQAHASQVIAAVTGAEAGYVASGAAACLTLATAACVTGLEPGRMARLPDAIAQDEIIVVRSQRNFYDHAVRAAGVRLVEVIDKYIGDSLMATFGTPKAGADDATRALRCARDALASLEAWNRERMGHGEDPLRFCVGLHYGPVVLGNIGNERRLEFTVIGDTVNVAARLEALTRRLGFDLIVSEDLVTAVRREGGDSALAGLIQGEAVPLRGRHGTVPIWMHHRASEMQLIS